MSNMKNAGPIRMGLIGCGRISEVHAEAAKKSGVDLRFVACVDPVLDKAKKWAGENGCEAAYDSIENMLAAQKLDAVLVSTWPSQHRDHVRTLIEGGIKFILCEKPLTMTAEQALDIWKLCKAHGAVVLEAFMFRHHPIMVMLGRMVAEGSLGAVDTLHASFQLYDDEKVSTTDATRNWRQVKEVGGGTPYDLTAYSIHLCTYLAGELPVSVSFTSSMSVYDTVSRIHGYVEYESGLVALIQSSRRAAFDKEITVNAEHGSLHVPVAYGVDIPGDVAIRQRTGDHALKLKDEYFRVVEKGGPVTFDPRIAQQRQLQHFVDVVRGVAKPVIPLAESIVNMSIIDAMLKSAETRAVTPVVIPPEIVEEWRRMHSGADRAPAKLRA